MNSNDTEITQEKVSEKAEELLMKKLFNKRLFNQRYMAVYLAFTMFVVGIGFGIYRTNVKADASEQESKATESSVNIQETNTLDTETKKEIVSSLAIDNQTYQLPCYFSEFKQKGWTLSSENVCNDEGVWFYCTSDADADTGFYVLFDDEGATVGISMNSMTDDFMLSDNVPQITLPQGITWGSSLTEIEAAYGKAVHSTVPDAYGYYEYQLNDTTTLTCTMSRDGLIGFTVYTTEGIEESL